MHKQVLGKCSISACIGRNANANANANASYNSESWKNLRSGLIVALNHRPLKLRNNSYTHFKSMTNSLIAMLPQNVLNSPIQGEFSEKMIFNSKQYNIQENLIFSFLII